MSRWLWALLAGVVLVAIAAVFWIAQPDECPPPGFARPNGCRPRAGPPLLLLRRKPRPRLRPHLRPRPRRRPQPSPAPAPPRRPLSTRRPMQDSKPPRRRSAPPPKTPSAPPVVAQEPPPAPAPLAEPPLPPPAPGREAQEVAGIYAPKSLAQLVGTWAYSAADCERLFQRRGGGWAYRQPVDKFAQAAIVESHEEDPSAFRHLPDRGRI